MKSKTRRILFNLTLSASTIFLLLITGCNTAEEHPGNSADGEKRLKEYVIADATGDWGYPTPYLHYTRGPGYVRMSFIFETLTWKDDNGIVPQLAESWEYLEEENAYLFNLRKGVSWHDGEIFNSEDVVFTFEYIKKHPYPFVDASVVKNVEAVTEYSVKIYLSNPFAPFFQNISGAQPILPEHIWRDVENPTEFRGEEATVGTGPYMFEDYSSEHGTYLYVANDSYYLGTPVADSIKMVKIGKEIMSAALKNGEVDYVDLAPELVSQMRAEGFEIEQAPSAWNAKMLINHNKEPFSSLEFRQAIACAIDRELLVSIALRGFASAGSPGMMPPSSPWFNPDCEQYPYNPAKTEELLEGLGYAKDNGYYSKNGNVLEVSLIAAADFKEVGQFIASSLENAGVKVKLTTMERKTVDAKVAAWNFDLSIYGHGGLYEPSILNRMIIGDSFNSARYFENNALNELCEAQLTEMDNLLRKEMVFQIQQIYAELLPALTLYYPSQFIAHNGKVGLYYTADGIGSGIPIALNRMAFVS